MSFLDENTGWLATSTMFGATVDGGVSWSTPPLPETTTKIATLDTYAPGTGYLLDQDGVLYFTQDDGVHWMETSHFDLGDFSTPFSAYQQAAMRFSDADHGIVVLAGQIGKTGKVLAFHTSDGAQSWTSETVPVISGPVYLSRDGQLLTVITGPNILTLLRYDRAK
jgi:outer membrane protein assembly factor BamB